MAYSKGRRVPAPRRKAPAMRHKPFVAPSAGWISATNLAASAPGSALILENWFPTTTGARMRGGSRVHATASDAGDPLESAMAYVGAVRKLFGGVGGKIIDLTAPADVNVEPAAAVSGQSSNYYSSINLTTQGGTFQLVANGTDRMQKFDGSTWAAILNGTDPDEIDGVDTDKVSHLSTYRNRVWMVEGGTMNAHYLPVNSMGGASAAVPLAGVFKNGGSLLFIATWSMDAGDGLDDKIVFVTTEGEIAVYQGDPADASTWGIVGRYEASPPLGKNAFTNVGGDLLILTEIGLIPLTAIINKDPAALALAAVSRNIQPDWQREVTRRRTLPWEMVKWTSRNIAFITCPVTSTEAVTPPICFAVNLETGAWSKVSGWNTRCFCLHNDQVFVGTNDGKALQVDIGGKDRGALIYYTYLGHADHLGQVGQYKSVLQARAVFRAKAAFVPRLSVVADYNTTLPAFPNAAVDTSTPPAEWDVGVWDQSRWDIGSAFFTVQTQWTSVGISGFAHSPVLLIVSGSDVSPAAELVVFEVTYEGGGLVV